MEQLSSLTIENNGLDDENFETNDADYMNRHLWEYRFKTPFPRNDASKGNFNHIKTAFDVVGGLTETPNFEIANTRFLCPIPTRDGLASDPFTLVTDIEVVPGPTVNSQREEPEKEYIEKKHGMRRVGPEPCITEDGQDSAVNAYTVVDISDDPKYAHQTSPRGLIVFCNLFWRRNANEYSFQAFDKKRLETVDNTGSYDGIETLKTVGSKTILHELLHSVPTKAIDVVISPKVGSIPAVKAYNWVNAQRLDRSQTLKNVDTYVFYAIATRLGDIGFYVDIEEEEG